MYKNKLILSSVSPNTQIVQHILCKLIRATKQTIFEGNEMKEIVILFFRQKSNFTFLRGLKILPLNQPPITLYPVIHSCNLPKKSMKFGEWKLLFFLKHKNIIKSDYTLVQHILVDCLLFTIKCSFDFQSTLIFRQKIKVEYHFLQIITPKRRIYFT